ncbi:MAG: hypothetical protein NT107_02185 [Planctomycetota bacterium]|nr:hypothetical protein [Planctomycetota bacterium]
MKRLLLFLVLLVAGFVVLNALVDTEKATEQPVNTQTLPRPATQQGAGIQMPSGGMTISTQISGPLKIGQVRLVPTGDGSRKETVYELSCQNTVPLADGTYRLDGVTVRLFDAGKHAANMTAAQAVVALREDANGKRSVREDKDLELTGVNFDSLQGARIGELHMECGRLRAQITDDAIKLRTPDDQEPVAIRLGGQRAGSLSGRGLRAHLPKNRTDDQGTLDIVILRDPILETQGITATAKGNLHYLELLTTGSALLQLDQTVSLALQSASISANSNQGLTSIVGDQLVCALQRNRQSSGGEAVIWEQIQLRGAPARVDNPSFSLRSPKLTVSKGLDGKPSMITAHGGPAQLIQRGANDTSSTFVSDAPIRLLQPSSSLAALHFGFGFPAYALRPLSAMQIVVFDGKCHLETNDGIRVDANRGLRLFRFSAEKAGGPAIAQGLGDVVIEQGGGTDRTVATGSAGFLLTRKLDSYQLQLGEDDAAAAQTFGLRRGEVVLLGTGTCLLTRTLNGTASILALSDAGSIQGAFGNDLGAADHLTKLSATITKSELSELTAIGKDAHFTFTRSSERISAFANSITQTGRASWQLLGVHEQPARIVRPSQGKIPGGELSAPNIEIHLLGAQDVMLDAKADALLPAAFHATQIADTDASLSVIVKAQRIRLLPFALPGAVRLAHLGGIPGVLANRVASSMGNAWVLAEGAVTADLQDGTHGTSHGIGEQLLLSQGSLAGLWTGEASTQKLASIENLALDGRKTTARGARIRFFRANGDHLAVLLNFVDGGEQLPPTLELSDPRKPSTEPLAHLHAECASEIEVTPTSVLFHGPVKAYSLLPDGKKDEHGMSVDAQRLSVKRSPETGSVELVEAKGSVTIEWQDLTAHSDQVEIDMRQKRCTAVDPQGAEVRLGSRHYRARRIEANYVNYSVRTWFGGFGQAPRTDESR